MSDLARAKRFYQDVLGMQFLFDAGTMAFFQCGTVRLMLGVTEQASPVGGTIFPKGPGRQCVRADERIRQSPNRRAAPLLPSAAPDRPLTGSSNDLSNWLK